MMAALVTNAVILFQFAVIDHTAACGTFFPQVIRDFLGTDQPLELGANIACQPIHEDTIPVAEIIFLLTEKKTQCDK